MSTYLKNKYKSYIEKQAQELTMLDKRVNKIKNCGLNQKLLEISYKDKSGNKTKRLVEPYKLIGDDFWGFDITKDEIRRFKTKNIKGIKETKKPFDARWDIQIN